MGARLRLLLGPRRLRHCLRPCLCPLPRRCKKNPRRRSHRRRRSAKKASSLIDLLGDHMHRLCLRAAGGVGMALGRYFTCISLGAFTWVVTSSRRCIFPGPSLPWISFTTTSSHLRIISVRCIVVASRTLSRYACRLSVLHSCSLVFPLRLALYIYPLARCSVPRLAQNLANFLPLSPT